MNRQDKTRDHTIDILRGFAVFFMIPANMIYILGGAAPFWLRFVGSFAAPFFVFIAGMMVSLTQSQKNYSFSYYFQRGLLVMGTGALIDVFIHGLWPFLNWDVLYLIGISLPIWGWLALRNEKIVFSFGLLFFVVAWLLRENFGYRIEIIEPSLSQIPSISILGSETLFKTWLIDGWFPIFPWTGVGLLGVAYGKVLRTHRKPVLQFSFSFGVLSMLSGVVLYVFQPQPFWVRAGYSELFYPPNIGFFLVFLGIFLVLINFVELTQKEKIWWPMALLGEASLWNYVTHLAIISYLVSPFFKNLNLIPFLFLAASVILLVMSLALAVKRLKQGRLKPFPYFLKFLLGS